MNEIFTNRTKREGGSKKRAHIFHSIQLTINSHYPYDVFTHRIRPQVCLSGAILIE